MSRPTGVSSWREHVALGLVLALPVVPVVVALVAALRRCR